jgi:hypothetical protein
MASVPSHCSVVSGACRGWPGSRIASGVTTMRGGAADAGADDAGAGADQAGAGAEGAGDAKAADASPAAASAVMQAKLLGLYIE